MRNNNANVYCLEEKYLKWWKQLLQNRNIVETQGTYNKFLRSQ